MATIWSHEDWRITQGSTKTFKRHQKAQKCSFPDSAWGGNQFIDWNVPFTRMKQTYQTYRLSSPKVAPGASSVENSTASIRKGWTVTTSGYGWPWFLHKPLVFPNTPTFRASSSRWKTWGAQGRQTRRLSWKVSRILQNLKLPDYLVHSTCFLKLFNVFLFFRSWNFRGKSAKSLHRCGSSRTRRQNAPHRCCFNESPEPTNNTSLHTWQPKRKHNILCYVYIMLYLQHI